MRFTASEKKNILAEIVSTKMLINKRGKAGKFIKKKRYLAPLIAKIKKNPNLSITEYAKLLNKGRHAVYNDLLALKLTTVESRINFANLYAHPRVLERDIKVSAVRNAISGDATITKIATDLNVARKTVYAWISEYKNKGNIKVDYACGFSHPRSLGERFEKVVLDSVIGNPQLSVHALAKSLGRPSHGVYNVLKRNNLVHVYQRIEYAKSSQITPEVSIQAEDNSIKNTFTNFITPNLAPAPPPQSIFRIFLTSLLTSSVFFYFAIAWVNIFSVGLLFATLALLTGSFFFVYSLKYYLTLGMVLSYTQNEEKNSSGSFVKWILGKKLSDQQNNSIKAAGLRADMENIVLKNKPFVSVQIALFNEKNVAERVAKAAIGFEYPSYEVILADDSTDETSNIITKFQEKFLFKGEKLQTIEGDGWKMNTIEVRPGVFLKHIHRTSRDGYKGKALKLALKLADPKTEYVSIFDADFVPYPDTLELFLKYFQVSDSQYTQLTQKGQQISMSDTLTNRQTEYTEFTGSSVAAVQGYQWHVLNKSENWITRGVRSEYAGSYVVERSGAEIYGGLKQISGSVYMIKREALEEVGWGTSITEDFELTLKLYEKGYKVLYTPYIQAPAECVSTLKRLIRQRMRWAEGHSFNVKKMFWKLLSSPKLTKAEKLEFIYLTPYYLQAFFFLVGTFSWLLSEVVFKTKLPFWTETWGWSLVLTNMISLPLLNAVGLFMEESEHKDYSGIWSFVGLSYIVVPFQAYAAVKGFLEKEEGPWFRTPKTGRITDLFARGRFMKFVSQILPVKQLTKANDYLNYLSLNTANSNFNNFSISKKLKSKWLSKSVLSVMIAVSVTLGSYAPFIQSYINTSEVRAFGLTDGDEVAQKVDTLPDDFLALNTNKTVYHTGETVKISLADINYLGETVCDAFVKVTVIDPFGNISSMSTQDNSVKVNKEFCENKKYLTVDPDYEARFETLVEGIHLLKMEASRFGETYTTYKKFEVRNSNILDISRTSATRIYPKNIYPMIIIARPKVDYIGIVNEYLPSNFDVFEASVNEIEKFVPIKKGSKIETGVTKGLQRVSKGDKQELSWTVDWKAGKEYLLSYFYDTPDKSPDLYEVGKIKVGEIYDEAAFWNLAIDSSGSGANTVSPSNTVAGATDQTFTFTYDPSETFTYGGEIRIKVPSNSGWSTPQGSAGTAGYTTASITGTGKIADLLVTGDATSEGSWTLTEDDSDACNTANPALDTGTKVEGSGSIKCDNSSSALTDDTDSFSFDNSGTVNWSSYDTIGFWMRSSKALTSTNGIEFSYDDTAAMSSLLQSYNTGTVSANTWTYFTFTLTATRTSVKAFGLVANGSGFDSANQWLDEVTIGPGSPSFIANGSDTDIRVRFISLDTNATVTVTYGSGGGTSGADVPSSAGSYEFTTRSRVATSTSLDSLADITTDPTITVSSYATAYSFQRKTWYDGSNYWRAYHDAVDARIEFEYSSDGSSWTENTSARISTSTYDFSLWADSSNGYIAYTNGYDIESRKASSYPGTGFSWGSATVTYDGSGASNYYRYPTIVRDSGGYIWIQSSQAGGGTLNLQISDNADDGMEDSDTNWNVSGYTGAGEILMGDLGLNMNGGFRFVSINIPQGATVNSATLSLYGTSYGGDINLKLYADDVDNAAAWSSSSRPSQVTPTTAQVDWDFSVSTSAWNDSPSLTSVIQEVVNRSGWSSGNAIRIAAVDDGTSSSYGGVRDYSNSAANSAKLVISYGSNSIVAAKSSSTDNITAWGSPSTLDSSSSSNYYGVIVPRTSGSVFSLWIDGTAIENKNFNGSSWDTNPTAVATGVSGLTTSISATSDSSGNVHSLYIDSSNNSVYRQFTTSWQTAVTLDSNTGNAYPSISIDTSTSDLYAFWVRSDDIFYKKGVSTYASGNWDVSATSWQTTGTLTWVSSVYSYSGGSFAVWTTGSGTPPIDWDIIAIPEFAWLFFAVGPIVPLLSKLRSRNIRQKKHGTKKLI